MRNKVISNKALNEIFKEDGILFGPERGFNYGDMITLQKAKEIFHPVAVDDFLKEAKKSEVHEMIFSAGLPAVICLDIYGLEKIAIMHNKIIMCLEAEKSGALDMLASG